jgi:hypothetical protein
VSQQLFKGIRQDQVTDWIREKGRGEWRLGAGLHVLLVGDGKATNKVTVPMDKNWFSDFSGSASIATLPPFGPIERQKWFDQISSQ